MDYLSQYGLEIYLVIIGLAGPMAVIILKKTIEKAELRRKKELKNQDEFHSLSETTPESFSHKKARKSALESMINRFTIIRRMMYIVLVLIWLIALMAPFLGTMSAAVISLITTATAILLGIAIRPLLENIISGIVISFSRQINTGDTILVDGYYGIIEDITMSHTIIKIWDWRRYVMPNSNFLKKDFINYSLIENNQWTYITFFVAPHQDLALVKELALSAYREHHMYSADEEPSFWVMDMKENSMECWLAVWTKFHEAWTLRTELRMELAEKFRQHNIESHSYKIVKEPPFNGKSW